MHIRPFIKILSPLIITLLFASAPGCKRSNTLFERVTASGSGITFTNKLYEKELFNILYYLYYYNGGGVAAGDINNDGLVDLYFTANSPAANRLYLNKGEFKFEDITNTAGVSGNADWCTGATMADVNNDGLLDIYVCAASKQFGLKGHNMLFINKGNNQFSEEAKEYGLDFSGLSTQAAFFDYDKDGDLDCYLLNHSKKPHANIVDTSNRLVYDSVFGDRLYRNEQTGGKVRFTDVAAQAGIYQSNLGYGLGLAIADFDNDGWDDIYVGNDFHENDYYYLNNRDGTFRERGASHFGHYSRFSMGNDAADFNNDGHIDLITVDMLPPDEKVMKTYGSDENPNTYKVKLSINGYQNQYSRNCIQINNGNGVSYSDIALLSDAYATDWSWCPLFADFDNDGNKDLFISSGIVKRPVDLDYVMFVSSQQQNKGLDKTSAYDAETIAKMPDGASIPFFFKGDGRMGFQDVSAEWGTALQKGYFNGAVYTDLDNDGRLDVVVNRIDADALVLKNRKAEGNWMRLLLDGPAMNRRGIGTKAYVFQKGKMQYQYLQPTRGFQSSVDHRLYFGLGSGQEVDSMLVVWPDQKYQLINKPKANTALTMRYQDAGGVFEPAKWFPGKVPSFMDVTQDHQLTFRHSENDFVDNNRQYLIPHALSTRGPKLAVADVNGDGLEDFYVCGAHHQAGVLMVQNAQGGFAPSLQPDVVKNAICEEVDALFVDVNGDNAKDLYVVSGGNELDSGNAILSDHLYLNNGAGVFTEAEGSLPPLFVNKSAVAAADIDGDGDIDLFVGGLSHSAKYGYPQNSYLLINDGSGRFSEASPDIINLQQLGMVTAARFADINNDGSPELMLTGEWMQIHVFKNNKGRFLKESISGSTGLWQSLWVQDVNGDNLPDLIAGNWGINSKLAAGKDGPLKLYVKDFDRNGLVEQVVCYTVDGKEYTFLAKDELERALPVLKKAYLSYGEVAGKTVQYMFYDLFVDYLALQAETQESAIWINDGKGFKKQPLGKELQLAPLFAFAQGENGTVWTGGNFYGTVPYEGRYDGQKISRFSANGVSLENLPDIAGEVRDIKWINVGGKPHLLLARNNLPLMLLKPNQ